MRRSDYFLLIIRRASEKSTLSAERCKRGKRPWPLAYFEAMDEERKGRLPDNPSSPPNSLPDNAQRVSVPLEGINKFLSMHLTGSPVSSANASKLTPRAENPVEGKCVPATRREHGC